MILIYTLPHTNTLKKAIIINYSAPTYVDKRGFLMDVTLIAQGTFQIYPCFLTEYFYAYLYNFQKPAHTPKPMLIEQKKKLNFHSGLHAQHSLPHIPSLQGVYPSGLSPFKLNSFDCLLRSDHRTTFLETRLSKTRLDLSKSRENILQQ